MIIYTVKPIENLGFSTFSIFRSSGQGFFKVRFATKVEEHEKLHRLVNFLKCLGPISDGDSFREIVF